MPTTAQNSNIWLDANGNPLPLSQAMPRPGQPNFSPREYDAYLRSVANVRGIQDLLPQYTQTIANQSIPLAQADLGASQSVSPGYAQLMSELFSQYGPQLSRTGSDILAQQQAATAGANAATLRGSGADAVNAAYDLSQVYDKPYYDTRALTSNRLGDLMNSIDLTGSLSPTELRAIEQSLALQGSRRGDYNAPSSTATVGNAMQYGNAGRQRVLENQNQLSKALAASAAFLPAAKSGIDTFAIGTGQSSTPNPGLSNFTGIAKPPQSAANLGTSLLGSIGNESGIAGGVAINQSNINANKKDWLDQFVQFTEGLKNVTSSASSVASMAGCWVAREVYGENNPQWLTFRNWLSTDAPTWLLRLYNKHGEQFAKWIKNKPKIKFIIRKLMDLTTK